MEFIVVVQIWTTFGAGGLEGWRAGWLGGWGAGGLQDATAFVRDICLSLRYLNMYCSELGGDSGHLSVIASGLWPPIFVDVLMAQLVRAVTGWTRWLVPCLGSPVQPQAAGHGSVG